jgi:hypothetical protein
MRGGVRVAMPILLLLFPPLLSQDTTMKKQIALIALTLAAAGSAWAGDADFKLVNKTGYAINEVYISPTQKANWGKDRLGEYQLLNGQSRTFRFGDTANCEQDIKVVFTDDESEVEWEEINLCEHSVITLKYNRKTDQATAELD